MSHPLERKIAETRRRARRLAAWHGLGRVAALVVAAVLAAGLGDYFIHLEDRGLRLMSTLGVLALFLWAAYYYLARPLFTRLEDIDVALRVERRFPQMSDRLASAVEFLRQREDDPYAGSAALRRAVVIETEREAQTFDWRDVFDTRPVRRSIAAGAVVCLLALLVVVVDPTSAGVALARLANPLGGRGWPQDNHLSFRHRVERLALGQALELEVVDARGAALPGDVEVEYRYAGASAIDRVGTVPLGAAAVARLENVTRPLSYRAVGGDDRSMPWIDLEIAEPAAIETLSVEAHYPKYTGWQSHAVEPHLRALVGTRIALSGTTTRPIQKATIELEDGARVTAEANEDGYGFRLAHDAAEPFVVERSGSYRLLLEDAEELVGGEGTRYEVRAVADLPPTVSMERPDANIYVTADAVVPVRLAVKDDLAIREVQLKYVLLASATGDEQGQSKDGSPREGAGDAANAAKSAAETLPLFAGPAAIGPLDPDAAAAQVARGDSRSIEYAWELSQLNLPEGAQLDFWAAANDYLPQTGENPPRRLTIISSEELQDRLAERQKFILGELARVLKLQRDARGQVASLEIQAREVGRLGERDIDQLQGAEMAQRQVDRELTSDTEGVPSQIKGLLAELRNNKVDSPDLERRMEDLSARLGQVASENLPVVARELTNALKLSQAQLQQPSADGSAQSALEHAGKEQDAVLASLEQMLGELAQWDNYRQFHREVAGLQREQQKIADATAELGRETLSLDEQELSPQQKADLKKFGAEQADLSRRLEAIEHQMDEARRTMQDEDPLAADTLSDALHASRQAGLAGAMRDAARHVEGNQIGQAAEQHAKIEAQLEEMLDVLANRREHELERLVKKLREAEQQLTELRREQDELRKRLEEAAEIDDPEERRRELERLTRRERELQEEAERFARRLERLQADKAGQSTARAGASMGQAGDQAAGGNSEGASSEAQKALQDLEEAQQQLAEARRAAEMDLAVEQLRKIQDSIAALRDGQAGVVEETRRLDEVRQASRSLSRAQLLSLRELTARQSALRDETDQLAERISAAEAFRLALAGAGRDMQRAADRLAERDTGAAAQRAESQALVRLEQLVAAFDLSSETPDEAQNQQEGGESGDGQSQSPGDVIAGVTQLKLIKLMQEEINRRTRELEESFDQNRTLSPDEQQEYAELAQEQGKLADVFRNITAEAQAEEQPEQLDLDMDGPGDVPEGGLDDPLRGELREEPLP